MSNPYTFRTTTHITRRTCPYMMSITWTYRPARYNSLTLLPLSSRDEEPPSLQSSVTIPGRKVTMLLTNIGRSHTDAGHRRQFFSPNEPFTAFALKKKVRASDASMNRKVHQGKRAKLQPLLLYRSGTPRGPEHPGKVQTEDAIWSPGARGRRRRAC